jgi:hypothetical protein
MRRSVRLLLPLLVAALTGCLGGTANPSYFPWFLPPGDIIPTHAKPPGLGYFRDFDPNACRLEVTPRQCSAAPGKTQVLIATVYDADGTPRRKRRVEWMIDGPGHIVEVDESGYLAGRGYKQGSKYAVSYTDYFEHTFDRGTRDPSDDYTIRPGQTWCIVTSAVEGQTTVTAYAPAVHDQEQGRVTVRLNWSATDFGFPPPTAARSGGEADLRTTLHRVNGTDADVDGLKVRYRVLDGGAPAALVSRSGGDRTSQSGPQLEAEVAADADGTAGVRVVQPTPRAGKTRIAVEVVKPDPAGIGPGTVVGRKETTVEWAAPQLTLDIQTPGGAGVNREAAVSLVVANAGKADSQPVTTFFRVPDGAEFVRAEPPPTVRQGADGRELSWALGPVAGGGRQTVRLWLKAGRRGDLRLTATAETPDGLRADQMASVRVDESSLKAAVELPATAAPGPVTATVVVSNPGLVPAENVVAWVSADAGLTLPESRDRQEVTVGTIPAGETKRVPVTLTASKPGRAAVRAAVTADGGTTARGEAAVEVKRLAVAVRVRVPETVSLGDPTTVEVVLTNTGDSALADVAVRATLPVAVVGKTASDGGKLTADGAEWRLPTLPPGDKRTLRLTVSGDRPTDKAVLKAAVTAGDLNADGEATFRVAGQPVLAVELTDVPGSVPVGGRATVRITVRNRGTGPARRVEVTAAGGDQLTPAGGTGADRRPASIDGTRVLFGVLDELPAGSAAVFVAELDAAKPGAGRVQAAVRADHLSQPMRDEQAVRVTGR